MRWLNNPTELFIFVPAIILALTVHEFSHAFTATLLGDPTAKNSGRLTLNPLRHIDWIGLLMIVVIGFGMAKPVMTDLRKLKNPKVDFALIAAAGPLSNIALAFVLILISTALMLNVAVTGAMSSVLRFLQMTAILNLMLAFFNMIPVPPFDGSKIFGALLPDNLYFRFISMGGRMGIFIVLIFLMFLGGFELFLVPLISNTFEGMFNFWLNVLT